MNNDFSTRFNQLVKDRGVTFTEVAKFTRASPATVSKWKNGLGIPTAERLTRLATFLKTDVFYLLTGHYADLSLAPDGHESEVNEARVPYYAEAGESINLPRSALDEVDCKPEHATILSVSGDSMHPVLRDRSIVTIDTSRTTIDDGDIYAFEHDYTYEIVTRIKYLYKVPNGIRIRSQNSAEHPDEFLHGDDIAKLKIIGRVCLATSLFPPRKK